MQEHPIQGLMRTAMENIKEMVDVNTIVGNAVETPDGQIIIPISKVGFGFAAGGSEFQINEKADANGHKSAMSSKEQQTDGGIPFGGGSGGGVSITPVAFLVAGKHGVQMIPLDRNTHLWDRLIDAAPGWLERLGSIMPLAKGNGNQATITVPLQNQS